MAEPPTVVVAGYGVWASAKVNPCTQILEGLKHRDWPDCRVAAIEIPVVSNALYQRIEEILLDMKPRAWLGLGVNTLPSAAIIKAEKVGINWRHFGVPDNAGFRANMQAVVEEGPAAYIADYPYETAVCEMKAAGIPAYQSFHAGTHLCNQMLYTSRHLAELHGLGTRCGFIHVPRTTEYISQLAWPSDLHPSMGLEIPSLSLTMMTEAVAIAVNSMARNASATDAAA